MNKSLKFKLYLTALIICIIGFNFSEPSMQFYSNPFYIGSFVFAIALIISAINYACPACKKNQVMRSISSYKLPNDYCYSCGKEIDEKSY
ncbi:hypothetical protein EU510_01370 [Pseudoalteromonas sp. FUC4]|nr:hypothetical protein EU510_01370 [Pseudoalteromonas sp. FUC4]